MEIKNKTNLTKELYLEVYINCLRKSSLSMRICIAIIIACFAFLGYNSFASGDMISLGIYIIAIGFFGVYALIMPELSAKKQYKREEKYLSSEPILSEFSEERFLTESEFGTSRRPYSHIRKFGESENACYFVTVQGLYIFSKYGFEGASYPEFKAFIERKLEEAKGKENIKENTEQ